MGKYKDAQPAPGTSQPAQETERERGEREEHRDFVTGNDNHNTVTSDPVMATSMLRRAGISGIVRSSQIC